MDASVAWIPRAPRGLHLEHRDEVRRDETGVPGDRATANTLVNAAPRVTAAEAGLLTVLELPAGR